MYVTAQQVMTYFHVSRYQTRRLLHRLEVAFPFEASPLECMLQFRQIKDKKKVMKHATI